jgi:SAM-dependent methyltransferase
MADDLELTEHATRNRAEWNALAPQYVEAGRAAWGRPSPDWGMWAVPEEQVHILPDVRGCDVLDLGCGTGYWCAWFARLGASPVGLDVSEAQLETARALQAEHRIEFPLHHASAEAPPFEDRSFDLVFSEYGAAIWCDPYVWIPQAFRILRPGGRLIFLGNSVLAMLTAPPGDGTCGEALQRPLFGMHRLDWDDTEASNFCLPHGEMLRLLRETGFEVEALHELRAPEDEDDDEVRYFVRRAWARQWPCEDVWVARRRPE